MIHTREGTTGLTQPGSPRWRPRLLAQKQSVHTDALPAATQGACRHSLQQHTGDEVPAHDPRGFPFCPQDQCVRRPTALP